MKTWIGVAVLAFAASSVWAQGNSATVGQSADLGGTIYASTFSTWTVPQGNNGPLTWSYGSACNSATAGGVTFKPLTVGTPVTLVDSKTTASEVVMVTSVRPAGSGCAITVNPSNPHDTFHITTATAGLQEAINYAGGRQNVVVITPEFMRSGGTTSTITSAKGSSNVTILDERTALMVPYTWNGSAYVATVFPGGGGGGGGGTAASPGGAVQFNNVTTPGTFAGTANFTFDPIANALNIAGGVTSTGLTVNGTGAANGLDFPEATPATGTGGHQVITADSSTHTLKLSSNGGAPSDICTAGNASAICAAAAGTPTSTAYRFGAYTNSVSGGNGSLTGSNLFTDTTGSDITGRNSQFGTSTIINTNCAHISSFGTMTCEEVNNNAQFRYRSGGSGVNNLRFDQWQATGPGWNIGPVLGTNYNQGWSVMIQHETPATMFTRGIHEKEGDGGFGWKCYAVGDCILRYDYPFYDGGSPDPSAESFKWQAAVITESQGFFHGTVTSSTVAASAPPYPPASKVVSVNLSGTSGPNHITDGTKLMYDPNIAGTTTCSFNGAPSNWSAGAQIGRIAVTGCAGAAIPTLYAWGTISGLIGDLPANGLNPSNVPVQQTLTVTPSSGSPAFASPDGINEWKSHVCIVGVNYIENSRLETVAGSSLTMDVRYPNNGPVLVLQGPACAPYQSVSIDSALTFGQQATSFWSFGTIDSGATLLISSQSGGSVGWQAIFRPGQAPWTSTTPGSGPNTAAFHLVNSSEIVANLAPNAFSPVSAQLEDNGFLPANTTSVWDPHFNSVSSMAFSIADGTSQYGGGAAASGIGYFTYGGPRITSAYQPMFFWNINPISMYKAGGGWADPPNSVIAAEGPHDSLLDMGHAPLGAFATIHNVYAGITDWDLFRLPHHSIRVHEDPGTGSNYIDFAHDGAGGIRTSYVSMNKDGLQSIGIFNQSPFNTMAIGSTVDLTNGFVNADGKLNLATVTANTGVVLPSLLSAPSLATDSTGKIIAGSGGGVSSLNTLTGGVTLAAGTGISVTPSGSTLTIANTGATGTTVASAEVVAFSSTPTFSTATNVSRIVLTANITSFTLGAGADGQDKTLCFKQGAGGWSVAAPGNVHGFFTVGTDSGGWNCQAFVYDLTDSIWLATSIGSLND